MRKQKNAKNRKLNQNIWRKFGQTIILVTHDGEIAKEAGRIITINDGKVVSDVK